MQSDFNKTLLSIGIVALVAVVLVLIRVSLWEGTSLSADAWLISLYLFVLAATDHFYLHRMKKKWHNPFFLAINFFSIYYVLGIVVYYLREFFYYNYPGDITLVNEVGFLSLTMIIAGYFTSTVLHRSMRSRLIVEPGYGQRLENHLANIDTLVFITAIAGYVGAVLFYDFFRDLPVLSNNIDAARGRIMASRGNYLNGVMILLHAISLKYFLYLNRSKGRINVLPLLWMLVLSIPLFLYGGRSLVMFPIIICILLYSEFRHSIPLPKVVLTFFLLFVASMLFAVFRMFGRQDFLLYMVNAISADAFPEMRSFAFSVLHLEPGRYFDSIFITPLVGIVPSPILALVGIDKAQSWKPIGAEVLAVFPDVQDILGIRISLIGEIFLGGGYYGIVIVMFLFGVLLFWTERKLQTKHGFEKYPYIVLAGILPLLITYGSVFVITCVFLFLESLTLVWLSKSLNRMRGCY